MRLIRLRQKYGFKTKGKGTPRRHQAPEATTEKTATPAKESEAAEEANENRLSLDSEGTGG